MDYIEEMIDGQAACLAIKSIYFDSIPDEAIELADAKQFPVFIFDETFLDTLVVEIDKVLNMYGHEKTYSYAHRPNYYESTERF